MCLATIWDVDPTFKKHIVKTSLLVVRRGWRTCLTEDYNRHSGLKVHTNHSGDLHIILFVEIYGYIIDILYAATVYLSEFRKI